VRASWLREPLVHFLLIGAALFLIGRVVGERGDPASLTIVVTAGEVDRLAATFSAAWHRPPTEAELAALVEDWTKEELSYREALAMGLDRDDAIVRRRIRQKLEYLAGDLAGSAEPTEEELATWLASHAEDHRRDTTFDLVQVFVRGGAPTDGVLAALNAGAEPAEVADPLHVPSRWEGATASALAATFGPDFPVALGTAPQDAWTGPILSGYGQHLVRLDRRVPGEVPPLAEIRDEVRRDLIADRRARAEAAFYEALRARTSITIEGAAP
jgi:peptidyl-prolyl cis-trans isomerase C